MLALGLCGVFAFGAQVSPEEFAAKFAEFDGTVFARWRIDAPRDFTYWMRIDAEVQPYGAQFQPVGMFYRDDAKGLYPAGQDSQWVKLPKGGNAGWNITFHVHPGQGNRVPAGMKLHFDFAVKPDPAGIFHSVDEELTTAGEAGVMMPCGKSPAELNRLMTYNEWRDARLRHAEETVAKLGPPPRLKRLEIGTGIDVSPTRYAGGLIGRDALEKEFKIAELLGMNSLETIIDGFPSAGIRDDDWKALAPRYGILGTGLRLWGGPIDWKEFRADETLWQTYQRKNDEIYKGLADKSKTGLAYQAATFANLGDEIGPAIDQGYLTVPILKGFFHQYLREQGLTPATFGKATWGEVEALDKLAAIRAQGATPEDVRRYYWTWRFMNYYTAVAYKSATQAVLKYFPNMKSATVNLQAGPVQIGYLGNSNALGHGNLDLFEFGAMGSFHGIQLEDWITTNDFGVGQICFSSDLLRAVNRKSAGEARGLLVGWWISPRLIAWLMQGAKHIELYSYGPISRIGPAWGGTTEEGEVADAARLVGKYEDLIADGTVKTAKAAMLIANTSDIMQARGLYFCPERQQFYIALKHGYLHVDFVSEQDIVQDDILKNYQLLYITDPQVRAEAQRKIAAWVQAGGHLWAEVGAANWDEYNQKSDILNAAFGVAERDMAITEKWPWNPRGGWHTSTLGKFNFEKVDTVTTDGKSFLPAVELPVLGAKLAATPTTGRVLGTYADGSPAIIYNQYGKGSALLVGALVGEAYARAHWPGGATGAKQLKTLEGGKEAQSLALAFAQHENVRRVLTCGVPGIYTSLLDGPNGCVVFINDSAVFEINDLEIRIPNAGNITRATSARNGELQFRMEGNDAVIIDPRVTYTEIIGMEKAK